MLICEVAWVLLAYDNSRTIVDFVKESRDALVRAPLSTILKGVTEGFNPHVSVVISGVLRGE